MNGRNPPYYQPVFFYPMHNNFQNNDNTKKNQVSQTNNNLSQTNIKLKNIKKDKNDILKEFLTDKLPILKMSRLIKLQAVMKGYYIRKFIIPRIKDWNKTYIIYTKEFINKKVQERIIPDLILETINELKLINDPNFYSPELKGNIVYMDQLLDKVIREESKNILNEVIQGFTKNLLDKKYNKNDINKNYEDTDFLNLVLDDFLTNSIKEEALKIIKESTSNVSSEYIIESQANSLINRSFLPRFINIIVGSSIDEIIIEEILNSQLDNMLKELSEPLSILVIEEEYYKQEENQLNDIFNSYINREFLDTALVEINNILNENNLEYIADLAMNYGKFYNINEDLIDDFKLDD